MQIVEGCNMFLYCVTFIIVLLYLFIYFLLYRVYQNNWSGFEVDYIRKYGE